MKKNSALIQEVYDAYGTSRTEFAKLSGISYHTLEGWETKGISSLGEVVMKVFLEKRVLEKRVELLNAVLLEEVKAQN